MADNILNKISQLPEDIQDYLFSEEIGKRNLEIVNKYKFSQKEKGSYFDIINKIFLKELSFSSLPAVLMSELKIDDDKVIKELMQDIKEIVLSPVKEYLGIDAGGRQVGYEENILIEKAVKKFNLFAGDLAPAKKFSEIADTFLSNVRTKAQFKNTLVKPVADGGLGMEHDLADDVAEFLASYMRIGEIEKKKKDAPISVIPSGARAESRDLTTSKEQTGEISPLVPKTGLGRNDNSPRLVPPNVKIEVSFEKEEKEAAGKKPKIEKMKTESPKLLSVTEGVKKALSELNYTFPSSELQERLKSIIDARVRNVRTSIQTFDKLTQDIPSGGMGFPKLEADKVSLVLNKYLEEKNKDIYGSKLAEIKKAEDEEKKKNEERARAAEEAERKNLDERFTKMTGKTPPPMPTPSVIPDAPSGIEGQYSGIQKNEIPHQVRDDAKKETAKKSIPLPPEDAPYSVIARSEVKRSDAAIPSKTGSPRPSATSGLAMTPKERPVLEDIKFTPKLAGPTEEIARLTLDDFRKLSGDPKEAILKIKDKLQLLREESFKKYQAGIEAWQKSPLYGEYLKAMSQSLAANAPLSEILKGEEMLTQGEFDAIINSRIGD